jgi:DNA-directed RNA polymerase subunit E'/Rpb7
MSRRTGNRHSILYHNIVLYKMDYSNSMELKECIFLTSRDLNSSIDKMILGKLRQQVEGHCIQAGYVMPNSIKLISRTLGSINNANFGGGSTFNVVYHARVCNPRRGERVRCYIHSIDKTQVVCYMDAEDVSKSPLEIYLYKNLHLGVVEFVNLRVKDHIEVEIINTAFNYGECRITVIAQYVDKRPKNAKNGENPAAPPAKMK